MVMDSLAPLFQISINGQSVTQSIADNIVEIVVDDNLYLPDMVSLRIFDANLQWINSDLLKVGSVIEINVLAASQGGGSGATAQIFKGEVTVLAPHFESGNAPTLVVRGYDRSHRLHRGKKSRSYLNMTDSAIAEKIAREANLIPQVTPTTAIYDYVFQDNQSDLEFLQNRAQGIGYQIYIEDQTLHFGQIERQRTAGPTLKWGENLVEFRPLLSTMNQVTEVSVRGWDPTTKSEIIGTANLGAIAPQVGISENGGQLAQDAFGITPRQVIVDHPVSSQAEASSIAQAICDELSGEFISAEGISFGDPGLQAGCFVTIEGIGSRFSGRYFVTGATHIQNKDGYLTLFNVSGRKADTLSQMIHPTGSAKTRRGIAIGIVTNNRDPEGMGRVKVRFPWLSDTDESTWARISAPGGGNGKGIFWLPEVNDEVLVAFEHGSINHPFILGSLWNAIDRPPKETNEVLNPDGQVVKRIMRSRTGHEIILDDSTGSEKIIIRDMTGANKIIFNSSENILTIQSAGSIELKAEADIHIESNENVRIQGKRIDLN